jgi:hypothetical protein
MKAQFGRRPRSVLLVAAVLMGSAFVLAIARDQAAAGHGQGGIPRIVVLSNRADLISGGDALVRVILPGRVDPARVSVELDGSDITSDFAVRSNGSYEGLVTGLSLGTNRLIARMPKAPGRRDHDHEPSDRGPDHRRPAGAAVDLPQRPERSCAADRRAMQLPDCVQLRLHEHGDAPVHAV